MQITFQNIPHQTFYNKKYPSSAGFGLKLQLSCDTVNFTGHWDLLKLSDETIFKRIDDAKKSIKNYLGQGGEALVYRIPDTNYCARFNYFDKDYPRIRDRNIDEADKVNHVVAKFGEKSSIMHYIEGSAVLTPYTGSANAKKIAEDIAQMPIKSFKELLHQICYAYDKGMMFDCNWGNIIVNPKENKLTAIDFYKNVEEESLKPLSYVFSSLVHEHTTSEQAKTYTNKILNAALEEFEPGHKPFWNVTCFDFSSLLRNTQNNSDFGKSPQCKILSKYLETLKELKVQDIRGIDVTNQLNGMLKIVKSLINQTL